MGADRLIGGLGNDRFVVDHVQDVVVEFSGQGFDTVVSRRSSYTLGLYVEDLESGDATSRTLIGNGYGNRITGHAGADTLNGAGGNDILTGRGGNDRMIGGPGDDFYYVEGQNDVVVEFAGQGIDTINTTSASYRLPNFADDLDAGYFTGSPTMNINTNRSMIGNNLDNIIRTNYGNDAIYGLGGSDTIYASDGRDLIVGGSGADVLYGGAGDDVFIYGSALDAPLGTAFTLIETLRDFQNGWFFGNDRIDLSRIDARAGGTVNEAFVYIGSWWFSGQAGELRVAEEWRWHTDGIYRWVQIASGDVNGDAYADFEIAIQTSDLPDIDWFIL
jgi:serralysin